MATTGDISKGSFLKYNGELCVVLEYEHRSPGKGQAFFKVKMRNTRTGKLVEHKFRSGEDVDLVRVETREYQFLYKEANTLVVMDNDSYEQINIPEDLLGDSLKFLKEGMNVTISTDEEGNPVFAEAPNFVELEVTYTEPGIKGDTATRTLKPATLETGAEVSVPLFVDNGDKIRIDTRTGGYMERVK